MRHLKVLIVSLLLLTSFTLFAANKGPVQSQMKTQNMGESWPFPWGGECPLSAYKISLGRHGWYLESSIGRAFFLLRLAKTKLMFRLFSN